MASSQFDEARRELLDGVRGRVLEIGFGTGLNIPHYPPSVQKIIAIDKNPGMVVRASHAIQASPIQVHQLVSNGERLPIADEHFDCVVSGWTLCSIGNVEQALREMHRVLKKDGRFFFVEHGRSPDERVQRWQDRLNPFQKLLADGCNLNRSIRQLIEDAGFTVTDLREFYMEKVPKIHGYMYQGIALK
ncbi:MAG: class I SAM-dependent methyltransferase [Gemmatimonadales bacterium]